MYKDFTLFLLSFHHPFSRQFHLLSYEDLLEVTDVSDFLKTTEQRVSKRILDKVYAYASKAV